jgi:GT2 family glycosyltransferase
MPNISIIIPVTRTEYIYRCLDSISEQKAIEEAEVIIISNKDFNPGSRNFSMKKIVMEDLNSAKRRNAGVASSRGHIIAFMDDDVIVGKDWICKVLRFLI